MSMLTRLVFPNPADISLQPCAIQEHCLFKYNTARGIVIPIYLFSS